MTTETRSTFLRLDEHRAPTLSGSSHVRYLLLADTAKAQVFVAVIAAEGGGNFNREAVALVDIERMLGDMGPDTPFPSKVFRPAFKGRSNNNAGYLCAALVHAGLLAPAGNVKHHLVRAGDWHAWAKSLLARDGEAITFPPTSSAAAAAASSPNLTNAPAGKPSKNARRGNRASPAATAASTAWPFPEGEENPAHEEGDHATHP